MVSLGKMKMGSVFLTECVLENVYSLGLSEAPENNFKVDTGFKSYISSKYWINWILIII